MQSGNLQRLRRRGNGVAEADHGGEGGSAKQGLQVRLDLPRPDLDAAVCHVIFIVQRVNARGIVMRLSAQLFFYLFIGQRGII